MTETNLRKHLKQISILTLFVKERQISVFIAICKEVKLYWVAFALQANFSNSIDAKGGS